MTYMSLESLGIPMESLEHHYDHHTYYPIPGIMPSCTTLYDIHVTR